MKSLGNQKTESSVNIGSLISSYIHVDNYTIHSGFIYRKDMKFVWKVDSS